ncbi:unnamed protein product [Cunninghamella echinulata]
MKLSNEEITIKYRILNDIEYAKNWKFGQNLKFTLVDSYDLDSCAIFMMIIHNIKPERLFPMTLSPMTYYTIDTYYLPNISTIEWLHPKVHNDPTWCYYLTSWCIMGGYPLTNLKYHYDHYLLSQRYNVSFNSKRIWDLDFEDYPDDSLKKDVPHKCCFGEFNNTLISIFKMEKYRLLNDINYAKSWLFNTRTQELDICAKFMLVTHNIKPHILFPINLSPLEYYCIENFPIPTKDTCEWLSKNILNDPTWNYYLSCWNLIGGYNMINLHYSYDHYEISKRHYVLNFSKSYYRLTFVRYSSPKRSHLYEKCIWKTNNDKHFIPYQPKVYCCDNNELENYISKYR